MPAGKHGSAEITVSYDDAPGGSLRLITSYVLTMGGIKITSTMQVSTAFGDTIEKKLPTGVSKIDPVQLYGFWDDTAVVGPHVVFLAPDTSPQASTRSLAIVFGNGKTWSSEGYLESYEVVGKAGALTEFNAVLIQNSGAWS
jgi:hypothetical protein